MPRNFFVLISALVIVSAIVFGDNTAATQASSFGYCAAGPDQTAAYVSEIFIGPSVDVSFDTNPIQNEFNEYLKGRYDFNSNSSLAVNCPLFPTRSEAQIGKRTIEMQMRQGNVQIVEVDWNYRLPTEPSAPRPQHSATGVVIQQADHTFCVSDAYQGTVYFTGPVATPPPVAMYSWVNGFTQFLKGQYAFAGRVYCNMRTAVTAQRLLTAHLDGSRAGGKRVVETNWRYDATQATSALPAATPDEDRQPAQRPAVQPPNLQARDFVLKENARVTAYCVADRLMASAFDCDCLRRQISKYRLDHVSDTLSASPTPFEEFFKGEKFDCKSCIQVDWKFKPGVKGAARFGRNSEALADCAVEKFRALLTAKPYPSRSRELLDEATRACR